MFYSTFFFLNKIFDILKNKKIIKKLMKKFFDQKNKKYFYLHKIFLPDFIFKIIKIYFSKTETFSK